VDLEQSKDVCLSVAAGEICVAGVARACEVLKDIEGRKDVKNGCGKKMDDVSVGLQGGSAKQWVKCFCDRVVRDAATWRAFHIVEFAIVGLLAETGPVRARSTIARCISLVF
jgi:hypothetical protein